MRKLLILAFISLFALTSCTRIDSANIGLKVDQFGSDSKGEPLVVPTQGMVFYNPFTTDIHEWEGYVLHKVWTKDPVEDSPGNEEVTVTAKDGGRFSLDVGLNFQVNRAEAANIFKKYRIDLSDLTNTRIRNIVRQTLVDKSVLFRSDSLLQYRATFEQSVSKALSEKLASEGFIMNNFVITDMRAPESYSQAIETKIKIQQMTMQAEANLKKVQADANAQVAAAKGEAESQRLLQQSLSPELLRKMWIEKWDGHLPSTVTGENSALLINK